MCSSFATNSIGHSFLLWAAITVSLVTANKTNETDSFDWSTIKPLPYLNYTDCYNGYKCAKLSLPLDWLNLTNPNNVSIAITKLPAAIERSDPSFGGPIVLNPGGPSGSGVSLVRRAGHKIQRIVDGTKHFDILSFDPRGVAFSEPNGHCFADTRKLELFNAKLGAVGDVHHSEDALRFQWAAKNAQGMLCSSSNVSGFSNGDNIRDFMSTPSVARDMIAIAEAEDELQKEIVKKTNFIGKGRTQVSMSNKSEKTLLQYWGFSYGTILGNTFVSLFPDRVGRVILDGVADAPDYMATGWTTNLQDTEKVVASFYSDCFLGGDRCPLYRSTDIEPADIEERYHSIIGRLKEFPIPVVDNGDARLITDYDVRYAMFRALYKPLVKFPELATALNGILTGNYTPIMSIIGDPVAVNNGNRNSTIPFPADEYNFEEQVEAAIACGDGRDVRNTTLDEFKSYIDLLVSQSPTVGPFWSAIAMACFGWQFRPKWRFEGPFVTAEQNATNHPILLIGNTGDPVTPLRNAFAASAKHEGSVVLTQNSNGHCSLLPTANECTARYVRAYFNDGTMPEQGAVCPDECRPWTEDPCEIDADVFGF